MAAFEAEAISAGLQRLRGGGGTRAAIRAAPEAPEACTMKEYAAILTM
jgi:hypothetical protein